jgi:hypothetical protein
VKIRLDPQGEFDEAFFTNASVHIERMDTRAWWIGIETPEGNFMINTGIADGKWFFNFEEDKLGGESHLLTRPACYQQHFVERPQSLDAQTDTGVDNAAESNAGGTK